MPEAALMPLVSVAVEMRIPCFGSVGLKLCSGRCQPWTGPWIATASPRRAWGAGGLGLAVESRIQAFPLRGLERTFAVLLRLLQMVMELPGRCE